MQANLRDVAAARRDELADELLATNYTPEHLLSLYRLTQRTASADRRMASAERHADAEDRFAAARDRQHAADDRHASAADRKEASLDPLTGAYNRAAGFKELRRDVDRARRAPASFTLAFVDVDGLKAINDAHGHAAGDRALTHVSGHSAPTCAPTTSSSVSEATSSCALSRPWTKPNSTPASPTSATHSSRCRNGSHHGRLGHPRTR